MDAERLLQSSAQLLGLPALPRNADGAATLLLDRRWVVTISVDPVHVTVAAALPGLMPADKAHLLLRANFTPRTQAGGHFAIGPDEQAWLLFELHIDRCQAQDVVNAIEACVNSLERWQQRFAQDPVAPTTMPHYLQRV